MGDPAGSAIALRAEEEAMGAILAARVAVGYVREAVGTPGLEVKLHNTTCTRRPTGPMTPAEALNEQLLLLQNNGVATTGWT